MILDYLLQMQISLYMFEIQISVYIWKERRKKRDNPCRLCITGTDFCVYVRPDVLIHPCSFTFSWNPLCLNSQSLFLSYKCISLSLFFYFAYQGHHMLFSFSVCLTSLVYDPPMSILVTVIGIIS